jgi:hypothetical protein
VSEQSARRWLFSPANIENRIIRLKFQFKIIPDVRGSSDLLPIFKPPYEVEIRGTPPELKQLRNLDPPMSRRKSRKRNPRKIIENVPVTQHNKALQLTAR